MDALVEGSVTRGGNRIRVHAQLIRGPTDEHFWSESYDRELGDALTLESDVAQSIAQKVEVTVTGEERVHGRVSAKDVLAAVPGLPVIDKIAKKLRAESEGERAAALELALEALYLAKRIDKVSGEGQTVYG